MESESKSETPCPDNAHGTPLTTPAGASEATPGNPLAAEHGRSVTCDALRRAEKAFATAAGASDGDLFAVSADVRDRAAADSRVMRSLRLAIAAGALPELDQESELVDLGAAAMLVLEAHSSVGIPATPELEAALVLLRERVLSAFGPNAVRSNG